MCSMRSVAAAGGCHRMSEVDTEREFWYIVGVNGLRPLKRSGGKSSAMCGTSDALIPRPRRMEPAGANWPAVQPTSDFAPKGAEQLPV